MAKPMTAPATEHAAPHVTRHLRLRCCRCGTSAVYDVGTVLYQPPGEGEGEAGQKHYSFTGYFRCVHCNSPGPWEVEDQWRLLGLNLRAKLIPRFAGLQKGSFVLVDGTVMQTPAMAEEHLLKLIQQQPRKASLYRRLGNVFRIADQHTRAGDWYAKALALAPHDIDSRYNLFTLALIANDIPATILHASLLVRDLLAGYLAPERGVAADIASFLVEDLRAAPDGFRQHFLGPEHKRSKRPEDVFIRTLLTQEGEEEDILDDAAQRLLDGVPEPSLLAGEPVVAVAPASALPAPPQPPARLLVPSLAEVVAKEGLDAARLVVAYQTPQAKHIRVENKHDIFVSDGQKAAIWSVPALADLFRGNQVPPPDLDHFLPAYVPYFAFVENQFLTLCDILGDRTDQEMEEIYAALRRRPDGRSLGVAHDLMWQIMALLLGSYVLSAAEYEGLVSALLTSARRWGLRPISRNYVAYLRRSFGHLAAPPPR